MQAAAYKIMASETYFAYINPVSDLDYFRFDIQTLNPITAKLKIPENVIYGLDLYDSDYDRLDTTGNLAGEETVTITYYPAQTGRYYVKIYCIQGRFDASKAYELEAVFDIVPPTPTSTPTNTPTPTDTPIPTPTPTVIG